MFVTGQMRFLLTTKQQQSTEVVKHYYFLLKDVIPSVPGSTGSPSGPCPPEENLWGLVEHCSIWVRCPSCHPAISLEVLKGIKSAGHKQ